MIQTMNKGQAVELLKKAYEKLKASDAVAACSLLEQALDIDFENEEIKHALKCVHWWLEQTRRIDEINSLYEKGSYLLSLFKKYFVFLDHLDDIYDQCQYSVRYFVYSKALAYFEELLCSQANHQDTYLFLLTGRCYKGLGNYDKALSFLEQAFCQKKEDAEILAEVADVNALLAETKTAKILFREAFFIDPFAVDLKIMESALIMKLKDAVASMGYKDEEINAWIPVYGHLWQVFSVKRELKQMEAGRLKQSVFSLETEYEANPAGRDLIKPRLLNHYFWLIDYYENSRTASREPQVIEEILLKIKVLDPEIYKLYTGN